MEDINYLEELKKTLGEEQGEKIYKLQKNLDKYLIRFKKEVNEILSPFNYEVLCGISYKEKK